MLYNTQSGDSQSLGNQILFTVDQLLGRLPIGDHMYLVDGEDGEAVMTNKLPLPTEVFSIPGRNSRYFDNPCT